MTVAIVTHPALAAHDTGDHPERAARWERTDARLAALGLPRIEPAPIAADALARVHPVAHGERIKAFCEGGGGRLDDDTVACPASYDVALLSAGAAIAAVDRVATGQDRTAVALCRPPGHHALADQTMGFCFFNNAALAARHAQQAYGLQRVVILDWDLHHGNGTEAIFYDDPSVLYLSTHQHPNWPGSGAPADVGTGLGTGFNVNVQLPIGTGDAGYLHTMQEVFAPVVAAFKPELIIISAGYDAHWRDPLGRMGLTVAGFAALTREAQGWADRLCGGKLVALMEGGYDLEALAASMLATVQVLAGVEVADLLGPSPYHEPKAEVERAIRRTLQAIKPYWPN
ncbi:MAG: histone deacetylase superfamily [Cyanobacteria bacterium RYN_339]|nr:histone deacetylase superfamily [Cyanobacteria bacterium RYN_339]